MKALRHKNTGEIYPMHDLMAKHPDVEFVDVDEEYNVIEPEEVGPAAEVETTPAARRSRKKAPTGADSGEE